MRGRVSRWGARRFLPSEASSAQALRHSQMRRRVRSRFMPSSAQPHTVITFQPSSFHDFSLRLSRLTFFDHFSIQNCTLLLGIVESAQPWRCQKHPRMSMMVLAFGTTMSGLPVKRRSQTRNLQPAAKIRLRTRTSGLVSRPLILLIILLRCSGVTRSITDVDYITP